MRFLNETAVQAGEAAVKELGCAGGVGGAVVLDRQGNGELVAELYMLVAS